MKRFIVQITITLLIGSYINCQPVKLITSISLADVKGRIDHLAYNRNQQLIYVAALGNNTVEVVDVQNKKVIHSIKGLSEPQGIRFIPDANAIIVANGGDGECKIFNSVTYQQVASVRLNSDSDNVRYSASFNKIYVGYGEGGIAVIDGTTFKLLADIKLPAHPESFQIDETAKKIYVNVPDVKQLEVIDSEKNVVIDTWDIREAAYNFPMALDIVNHRLFIGCRNPAKLLVIDAETGKTISTVGIDGDTDDLFYDSVSKQIYVSCGGGFIDIFKQESEDKYENILKIETRSGARTSLFVPELKQLIVAAPARSEKQAELMVYQIN